MLKRVNILLFSLVTIALLQAKDYEVDKNGNVNVNVIDSKVVVNGRVVRTLKKGERIKVNENGVKASVGADNIDVNIDSILKKVNRIKRGKESKGEQDFFGGDSFFK